MAEIKNIKTTFIGGEQTDSLNSRVDIDQYYKGVKKALNVLITQQGTVRRRDGTRILRPLPDGTSSVVDDEYKIYSITGEDDNEYLILFYDNSVFKLKVNDIQDLIDGESANLGIETGFNTIPNFEQFKRDNGTDFIFGQADFIEVMDADVSLNTMVITHPDFPPYLLYIDENGEGVIEELRFKNIPQFNFNDDLSPQSTPFNAKLTMMRPAKTVGDTTAFSISIDGNVSNKITTTRSNANFAAVGREIDLDIPLDEDFDLFLRESSSKYRFERGRELIINDRPDKFVEGELVGEKRFRWNSGQGTVEEFCDYLTIKLTQIFFKETCDFVISTNKLQGVMSGFSLQQKIEYLPIFVEYVSGTFGNLKIKLHAGGGIILDEKYDSDYDTDVLPFVFSAAGYYDLVGDVVVKNYNLPTQKTNNPYVYPPVEPVDVNTSPWGIFFAVKKQIRLMNVVSDMKNVFVWHGTYGIFAPYGGGQDSLGGSGNFDGGFNTTTENLVKIGGFATPESPRSGNINGQPNPTVLSQVEFYDFTTTSTGTDLAYYILGDVSSDTSGIVNPHPLQSPAWGARLTYGERIRNLVYSINIDIKYDDARSYKVDMVNDTERAGYRDAEYPEDVAAEAEYASILIAKKGNSRAEDAFSAKRKYPSKVRFIDRRLCFANTPYLPNRLWFSVVDDFFNFQDDKDGTELSAINAIAPISKAQEAIQALTGNKSLQVFTTDSEHYNPREITATEISLPQQSNYGIKKGTEPCVLDNTTFYIDKLNNLRAFIYDDLEQSYKSYNTSVLAKHLMENVKKIKPVRNKYGTFIYCLRTDGSIVVFQTLREQNINNFTVWKNDNVVFQDIYEFQGKVLAIANKHLVIFDENVVGDLAITRTKGQFYQDINQENVITDTMLESKELNKVKDIIETKEYTYTSPEQDVILAIDYEGATNPILDQTEMTVYNVENPDFQDPMTDEPFFYFYDLRDVGFKGNFEFSYNFPVEIETKDIAYDIGRGQELVGRKKFTRAYLSLLNGVNWELYKDGYKYGIRDYQSGFGNSFNRVNGDVEVRLTGYHNRVNINIKQELPLLSGELQAITLAIKT